MFMQDMTGTGQEAVSTVVSNLLPRAKTLLEKNGCRVSTWGDGSLSLITFPQGTIRTELYPQTQEARHRLRFQNGFELREISVPGKEYKALFTDTSADKMFLKGEK